MMVDKGNNNNNSNNNDNNDNNSNDMIIEVKGKNGESLMEVLVGLREYGVMEMVIGGQGGEQIQWE